MKEMEESVRMLASCRSEQRPLTIVVTGCTSGIGLEACKLLYMACPNSRLFLVARSREKALQVVDDVASTMLNENGVSNTSRNCQAQPPKRRLFPMVCDHSSFDSVREFCQELKHQLHAESQREGQHVGIDVLCLNAAIFLGEDATAQYTNDNLELTMQTNHFAPFLIANHLFNYINPGARVVVTSSGLHSLPSTSFGNFEGIIDHETGKIQERFQMIDGSSFDHKQCYAISKLCNVAFCLALNRRLQSRNAKAVCFTPGLIPSSGLFRHQKRWHETCLKQGAAMVETALWGGRILAWMAISDKAGMEGGCYWRAPFGISQRGGKIPDDLFSAPVNDEAKEIKNQEVLW
eukprot:CAMPEP_0178753022 /NCGR_PEP_ID=MMETSP0744-20121128/11386_1 /TAXON_ID=913974 /ORGANISM="Nitzschia punctata, Strain CCMP561" /LENGTH=348 /DNA_ID=CAMNT_0020406803 /DNA_START=304 /DNA_END=1347 /DNA_ORIENTATION=+